MTTQSQTLSATERTRLRRHSERAQTEHADLLAVLDAGMICHLGVVVDGSPVARRPSTSASRSCPAT